MAGEGLHALALPDVPHLRSVGRSRPQAKEAKAHGQPYVSPLVPVSSQRKGTGLQGLQAGSSDFAGVTLAVASHEPEMKTFLLTLGKTDRLMTSPPWSMKDVTASFFSTSLWAQYRGAGLVRRNVTHATSNHTHVTKRPARVTVGRAIGSQESLASKGNGKGPAPVGIGPGSASHSPVDTGGVSGGCQDVSLVQETAAGEVSVVGRQLVACPQVLLRGPDLVDGAKVI